MNRLLSSSEHAPQSTMLFLDSHRTVQSLPLTSVVTTLDELSAQRQSSSQPDRRDGVHDEIPLRLISNGLRQKNNNEQLDKGRMDEFHPSRGRGHCSEGRGRDDFSESSMVDVEKLSSGAVSYEDTCTLEFSHVDACDSIALIDEDDDDVSLRERTVTDVSVAEGNAAELVCGRVTSLSLTSSHSISERLGNSLVVTPLPEEEEEPCTKPKDPCCNCRVL